MTFLEDDDLRVIEIGEHVEPDGLTTSILHLDGMRMKQACQRLDAFERRTGRIGFR